MLYRIAASMSVATVAVLAMGVGQVDGSLLIEMKFNEPATTAVNTATGQYDSGGGTMSSINDGIMREVWGGPLVDRHTADGMGVSGLLGDHAFDAGGVGDAVVLNSVPGSWSGQDFTMSGWFKTAGDTAWGGDSGVATHLGWAIAGSNNQFRIRESGTANTPELFIASTAEGGNSTYVADAAIWTQTEEWVFWAVTFEGTAGSDVGRVKFYAGTSDDSVSLVATADGPSRTVAIGDAFIWGNDSDMAKGFVGLMDNLRFHSETLSLGGLEEMRAADAIPEPASLALLGLGAMSMLLRRRQHAHA